MEYPQDSTMNLVVIKMYGIIICMYSRDIKDDNLYGTKREMSKAEERIEYADKLKKYFSKKITR